MTRHYFLITARFGPPQLFQALRQICEDSRNRRLEPKFDFDWLKRRIELSANDRCGVEDLLEILLMRVQKHGKSLLLPGETQEREGRHVVPIGVLIQTPDIYAELMMAALSEFGMTSIRREFDGDGFSVGVGPIASAIPYKEIIDDFPLPEYLAIEDKGLERS